MKIDLHCHSKHSKRPSLWLMQKLGCPECFTEPAELYEAALRNGMTAVTITDHNVIDGCLEIAHLERTFVSCEYTAYFPKDDCKVHVLAYGITEAQHRDLNDARKNLFELVAYLNREGIRHACAHPFFAVNDRLTPAHIEQLVLLFKTWEWNGELYPEMNAVMERMVARLTCEDIERFANQHGIVPAAPEPWRKHLIAGSDDHSSLNVAFTHTDVPGAADLEAFWAGVARGEAEVRYRPATPQMTARNMYGIAYQFYTHKFHLEPYLHKDVFLRFLHRMLQTRPEPPETWGDWLLSWLARGRGLGESAPANASLMDVTRFEAERLLRGDPRFTGLISGEEGADADLDQQWFAFVTEVSNQVIMHQGRQMLDGVLNAQIFDLFHSMGSAGALYSMLAPYFVGYSMYSAQRAFTARMEDHFETEGAAARPRAARIAHFADLFDEDNDVTRDLEGQRAAAFALGKDYRIVACSPEAGDRPGVRIFRPVDTYAFAEAPEVKLVGPPFLEMLHYCYEEAFTHVHVATPGPMGLAGLGIARILQLPISGTYYDVFAQYAKRLTDDTYMEDAAWRYMAWFYDQLDTVLAPSDAVVRALADRGLDRKKLRVFPHPVDTQLFQPAKRGGLLAEHYGIGDDSVSFLYAGALAKGKALDVLVAGYTALLAQVRNVRLIITGDGPHRAELEAALTDTPAVFTGALQGEDLAAVYASCDALVYPGRDDPFGYALLEAQASGIPVIAADEPPARNNIIPEETGLLIPPNDPEALAEAMATLVRDAPRRETMGHAARRFIEQHGPAWTFENLWALYTNTPPAKGHDLASIPSGK